MFKTSVNTASNCHVLSSLKRCKNCRNFVLVVSESRIDNSRLPAEASATSYRDRKQPGKTEKKMDRRCKSTAASERK